MSPDQERVERPSVGALDEILGQRFGVLDDGFVRVVDYMGSDEAIVQAARVSYGRGTKRVHQDRGLIRYLMRHRHTTPFEMCEIKLHVRVPMDCWRQWIRHRTASVNEYSTRYSEAIDSAQRTAEDAWRLQSSESRQGSEGMAGPEVGAELSKGEAELQHHAVETYQQRLQHGVAREQARKDLPLSTYTEAYWKIDLHNLLHFLELRMDAHAQYEIRQYANVVGNEIVARWVPTTWKAFLEYRREAITLTDPETQIVRALNSGDPEGARKLAVELGWLDADGRPGRNRERSEAELKLSSMGFVLPWQPR
jgi:thymidylate synthase (FAD)